MVTEPPKSPPGLHLPKGIYFPDYKTYKVEDVPQLMEVQKQLAARGLKDPWLRLEINVLSISNYCFAIHRNYVWRYHPNHVGTKRGRMIFSLGRGMRTGAVLIFLTWIYETYYKEHDHHGHGHHGSKVEHDLSSH